MNPSDAATIQAGTIGAHATLQAAWIQFSAGGAAALGAILAGVFAYLAATRQVRLQEAQARARTAAYKFRLGVIVDEIQTRAVVELSQAEIQLRRHHDGAPPEVLITALFAMPDELTPDRWEDHAMLGEQGVRAIHTTYVKLREAIRFNSEMRGRLWGNVSLQPTLRRLAELPDGALELI